MNGERDVNGSHFFFFFLFFFFSVCSFVIWVKDRPTDFRHVLLFAKTKNFATLPSFPLPFFLTSSLFNPLKLVSSYIIFGLKMVTKTYFLGACE